MWWNSGEGVDLVMGLPGHADTTSFSRLISAASPLPRISMIGEESLLRLFE
jgi:hypothetical protein